MLRHRSEATLSARNRYGVSDFFFSGGFATSRMQLMKSCARLRLDKLLLHSRHQGIGDRVKA
jgi:hypothetical protein